MHSQTTLMISATSNLIVLLGINREISIKEMNNEPVSIMSSFLITIPLSISHIRLYVNETCNVNYQHKTLICIH